MLKVSRTKQGRLSILSLGGRLDAESKCELEKELRDLIDAGDRSILIDMEDLSYISSAGIALILSIRKELAESGSLALARLQSFVKKVFEAAELNDVLTLLDGESEINGFMTRFSG
jgi:anti-sigma B factor antagonist